MNHSKPRKGRSFVLNNARATRAAKIKTQAATATMIAADPSNTLAPHLQRARSQRSIGRVVEYKLRLAPEVQCQCKNGSLTSYFCQNLGHIIVSNLASLKHDRWTSVAADGVAVHYTAMSHDLLYSRSSLPAGVNSSRATRSISNIAAKQSWFCQILTGV